MAVANDSGDQSRIQSDKGIPEPTITAGMNKTPAPDGNDADIISKAKKLFAKARKNEDSNRNDGLEDLKFIKGEQWSAADASARSADGRPCITENRLPTFANQIINDQRQNKPSIVISPMGDKASKKDAKILRGMIKAIERDSSADVAYDTGFQSAVHNGWGYWRVMTEYESEDSFNKVIVIKPIENPFNVYLDSNRTQFMMNAKWGFITEMIPRDDFKREYPDANPVPWAEIGIGEDNKEWVTAESIRVAEYYYFEYDTRTLIALDNGHTGWKDKLDDSIKSQIESGKIEVISEREVETRQLKWVKMTAYEIIEKADCDGTIIPIIECLGSVININGSVTKKGIVRDAKGAQMMANYYSTLEAENVALQPKAPWVMEEGQIEGHEDKWTQANKKSFSVLTYRGVSLNGKPAPPPQRQAFAGPPQAILAAKQGTIEALKAVTGIRFDATMSERMQDESGRAIRELSQNSNLGCYHFIDNFGRALRDTGLVLIDLIPHVYDTRRIISILDDSGEESMVQINPDMPQAHGETTIQTPERKNQKVKTFNPKVGRYKVTVTIGPSYATKRIEAQEKQMEFVRAIPATGQLISDLIAKNSDWEGAEEIAARLAKALPPNLLSPDIQNIDPQIQALLMSQKQQLQQQQQQMMLMQKELADRQKDRDVMNNKTQADYETKILQIEKKFEADILKLGTKIDETQAKRDAVLQGTIGRQLAEIAKHFQQMKNTTDGDSSGKTLEANS